MKIEIFFGAIQLDKTPIYSETQRYYEFDSVNDELHSEFSLLIETTVPPRYPKSLIQTYFSSYEHIQVIEPKVSIGSHMGLYKNEYIMMPTLIFQKDYLVDEFSNKRYFLTDEIIIGFGKIIESTFQFEYLGFERLG